MILIILYIISALGCLIFDLFYMDEDPPFLWWIPFVNTIYLVAIIMVISEN